MTRRRLLLAVQTTVIAVATTSQITTPAEGSPWPTRDDLQRAGAPGTTAGTAAPGAGAGTAAPGARGAGAGVRRHAVGLGPVVQTALGGSIFGWDINENGTDGVLAESVTSQQFLSLSAIETFDQSTGAITKLVAKQKSVTGKHQLVVAAVLANDVGLIDDERVHPRGREDVFDLMSPVTGGVFTGTWTPPNMRDVIIQSVADQQTDPLVAIMVDDYKVKDRSGVPELLVSDVAKNTVKFLLKFPPGQVWYGPQIVAQDTKTHEAVIGAQAFASNLPDFVVFDLVHGTASTFPDVKNGFGPFEGIAIDSTTDMMCTTTGVDYSVEFYNLRTHAGISEPLPGAGGELQAGAAIAADPVNHLFLVTQPSSSVSPSGGSTIFVYGENGTLEEVINGFSFSNTASAVFERVEVNASQRVGFVNGLNTNELQSFTY